MTRTVVCVVGTRPEVVKMAPVVRRLRAMEGAFRVRLLATGQHRELLDRALADFGLEADHDLALMKPGQTLPQLTALAIEGLSAAFAVERPDLVLAQGDTTSVFCAALAAFYQRIPFGHVEAGLRTGLAYAPFPEEKNRVLAGQLAELHFAPTEGARCNLLAEGIDAASIHVTGNTVIDALRMVLRQNTPLPLRPATERFVLVTAHRREHFGAPLEQICLALRDVVERHADLSLVFPVHPNPQVRGPVQRVLGDRARIHLIEPVSYPEFVALMNAACLVLTDSGGVQEEAPALGKPVVILREATERPETLETHAARLVGPRRAAIGAAVDELLEERAWHAKPFRCRSPFGDGWASERIARALCARFGIEPGPAPAGMRPDYSTEAAAAGC
jgi:UDP-N-acetylglucosamine 2-epimerase (non-hydrolysing)